MWFSGGALWVADGGGTGPQSTTTRLASERIPEAARQRCVGEGPRLHVQHGILHSAAFRYSRNDSHTTCMCANPAWGGTLGRPPRIPHSDAVHGLRPRRCRAERPQDVSLSSPRDGRNRCHSWWALVCFLGEFRHARPFHGIPEIDAQEGRHALHGGWAPSRVRRGGAIVPALGFMRRSLFHSAAAFRPSFEAEVIMSLSPCRVIGARSKVER
ncbi:cruzipain [Trypanosoma cruzi]|nr:cruzipain [Trypanosoma cruzi]